MPGTTSDKLNRLNQTKQGIKAFLISEGQEVSNNDTFYSYVAKAQATHKNLGPKTITENGTYNPADDNLDGYNLVIAEGGGPPMVDQSKAITANGSYICPEGVRYNPIVVSVVNSIATSDTASIIRMMDLSTSWTRQYSHVAETDYTAENVEIILDLLISLTEEDN